MIARAFAPRHPVVVHPQFTERKRRCGPPAPGATGWMAGAVPAGPCAVPVTDLVVIGNPTNPTSVLHPAARSPRWPAPAAWSGRRSVRDCVPGEPESLAESVTCPGDVCAA